METAERIAGLTLRDDGLGVEIDDRPGMKPGAKYYDWERKGVPLRLEIGPRDLESGTVMSKLARQRKSTSAVGRRRSKLPMEDMGVHVGRMLDGFQEFLFHRALALREANTRVVDSWEDFQGRVCEARQVELRLRPLGRHETRPSSRSSRRPRPPSAASP